MAEPAEKSLDDFFAKRDKKKKKEKVKGKEPATGSSTTAVVKKMKKEKEKSSKNENQDAQVEKEDEEWKEFEQKEVDYSGLRLQALLMSDEKDEEEYEKEEIGEDGEIILVSGDKVSGPWNKSGGAPPAAAPVEEEELPEVKPAGVYRPPGARLTPSRRGPSQGPPEIFSDAQFPSLLSTAKHVETRKDREMEKTFEVVKHKSRGREETSGASIQHLQLDNQYAILGDK
ncbi:protein CDV3 homolog isoform X1 [Nematolebias whitei]|uniref:protein CDV3 homolog isoform X1 n=1 Tax=Nematolebias whitei TaxID=451745 RepID=UPI001899F6E2|nr:protein CDV3 homolog isoform X1 [Nematolebias whitei]XP_037549726.1 protein CDV3 homolog isoform X1 [Nematolebias whitei]XP_037549727.1 protein CDV3 homolog isoform X1 [Nematolebias whitei]